jgi:hypothetical protein
MFQVRERLILRIQVLMPPPWFDLTTTIFFPLRYKL